LFYFCIALTYLKWSLRFRMKRILSLIVALGLGSSIISAQPILIQTVEKNSSNAKELVIPYKKYELNNGLTVIIHEDHSDPIVHVDVTYHVGSSREELGKSGFAHFFEHMMFQGSKHVGDEQHFKIISGAGGTMNGTTNRDRTNYFETIPKNYLETALWLESDRMGFLLDSVTQKKFEVQRATVKNEKGQNYENRPYGMAGEIAGRNFYPFAHPYSWTTIGYVDDLNRANVDDLKRFFTRWYGPNNAVLTIGGDVNTEEVIKMVDKYFGVFTKCPPVNKMTVAPFTLDQDRYVSYEDNVKLPMLRVMFNTVANFSEDEAPLDILSEIIGSGKSSILYQDFVKTGKLQSASASHACSELGGDFDITILGKPNFKLSEAEKMVRQTIDNFLTKTVTEKDIQKAIAGHTSGATYGLESVSGKVSQLASYQTFTGDANYINKDIKRYEKVTKADIIRVYEKYLKNKKALYLSVVPKGGKELLAAADNYQPNFDSSKVMNKNEVSAPWHPTEYVEKFDRFKQPIVGESPVVKIPKIIELNSKSGIKGSLIENHEVPTIGLLYKIPSLATLSQPKGKEGVASILNAMLNEASQKRSAEAISDELDLLSSFVTFNLGETGLNITIQSLTKNFKRTMEIAAERLFSPKFDEADFNRIKNQSIVSLSTQKTQATTIANAGFRKLLYSTENPLGRNATEASLTSITLADVKDYYESLLIKNGSFFAASGDISANEITEDMKVMESFPSFSNNKIKVVEPTQVNAIQTPKIEKTKIYLIHKEKAPQSEIRIGYVAMPYDAYQDFFKSTLMNYILGGAFNSRINLNLRENKGYTYGARSGFSGTKCKGIFQAAAGVKAEFTAASVKEFMFELKRYADSGITDDELAYTKKAILEREALNYESNLQKSSYVFSLMNYSLSQDFSKRQAEITKGITNKEINKLAKEYIPYNNMIIVVVGDKNSNMEPLKALGYEVIEYTENLF